MDADQLQPFRHAFIGMDVEGNGSLSIDECHSRKNEMKNEVKNELISKRQVNELNELNEVKNVIEVFS